ncbi:hypothetical protein ACFVU0_06200 [Streptomyces sp. NPDC058122]|uniref:hypothetical protein n=1 Tax=Streptomyces sp. NPDC058122 TaxID=3346349 RepID=UPI0036DFF32F
MAFIAAALVTACAGHGDDGSADARRVCESFGAGHGVTPDSGTPTTDTDWTKMAEDLNVDADNAASAARKDVRWNRLADAMSTLQRVAADWATQQSQGSNQPLSDEDARSLRDTLDAVESECRKARAE